MQRRRFNRSKASERRWCSLASRGCCSRRIDRRQNHGSCRSLKPRSGCEEAPRPSPASLRASSGVSVHRGGRSQNVPVRDLSAGRCTSTATLNLNLIFLSSRASRLKFRSRRMLACVLHHSRSIRFGFDRFGLGQGYEICDGVARGGPPVGRGGREPCGGPDC
jgi:hypothetical protein